MVILRKAPSKPAQPAGGPSENDIVADMLATVRELWPNLPADTLATADRQIRERWGGDEVYVPLTATVDAHLHARRRSQRDAAIWRDNRAGERAALLCLRYGISRARLYQILAREPGVPATV